MKKAIAVLAITVLLVAQAYADGIVFYMTKGTSYCNAVQCSFVTIPENPKAHSSIYFKGGQSIQIQTSDYIYYIPIPTPGVENVSVWDIKDHIADAYVMAARYPKYAEGMNKLADLWKAEIPAAEAREKQKLIEEEEARKRDAETKQRLATEAEQQRLAAEAEQKRLAAEAEQKRLAAEAEDQRLEEIRKKWKIKDEEEKRLAQIEADKKRNDEIKHQAEQDSERQRLQDEADSAKIAEEESSKRIAFITATGVTILLMCAAGWGAIFAFKKFRIYYSQRKNKADRVCEYYIIQNEVQCGPYTQAEIKTMLEDGVVTGEELIWEEGLPEWTPIKSIKRLYENKSGNWLFAPIREVQSLVCWVSGLAPLTDFKLWFLFSDVIKRHSSGDVDDYLSCGSPRSTPDLNTLSVDWPRPWYYARLFFAGLIILVGFIFGFLKYENSKMLPGIIFIGAFFVPLACVAFFFETNITRNISLYKLFKVIVGGGIFSLLASLIIYELTDRQLGFLGPMSAGIVEETGKAVIAVFILQSCKSYKWILNGMLIGAAVGAGFAGFETAGYIMDQIVAKIQGISLERSAFDVMCLRALYAPFGHVIWTACIVGSLWRVKGPGPFQLSMLYQFKFIRVLIFVMGLHMLWNSPASEWIWSYFGHNVITYRFQLSIWLISFIGSWYLVLLLIQSGLNQIKEIQRHPPSPT